MKLIFLLTVFFVKSITVFGAVSPVADTIKFSDELKSEIEMEENFNKISKQQNRQKEAERRTMAVKGKQTNWGVKAPILGAVFLGSSAFVYLGYKNNEDANRMITDYKLSKDPDEILVLRDAIKDKEDYRNLYYGLGVFGFASFTIIFVAF